jgi:LytTr DNA-binding domain
MLRYDNEGLEKWWMYYWIRQLPKFGSWLLFAPLLTNSAQRILNKNHSWPAAILSISFLLLVMGILIACLEGICWLLLNSPAPDYELTRSWRTFLVSQTFFHCLVGLAVLFLLILKQSFATSITYSNRKNDINRLVLKHKGKTEFVPFDEISHLKASGSYVEIYSSKGKSTITGSLKHFSSQLPFPRFIRIHRSFIVNVDQVKTIISTANDDYKVITHSGEVLRLSRTYKESLTLLQHPSNPLSAN